MTPEVFRRAHGWGTVAAVMTGAAANPTFVAPRPEHAAALEQLLPDADRRERATCLAVAADGALLAAALIETADVELVGGERFALYETVPAALPPEQADALLSATYRALDAVFDPEDAEGPIGLCLLVADRREMKRRPEAFWPDPPMHYVGFLDDGRLVRVGYFTDAALRGPA